ncbi:CBS domain-containing protein [Nitrospira sp. M1]
MMVKDIMTPTIENVKGSCFLYEAALKMKRLGTKQLPVMDYGQLVGILTDEDIAFKSVSARKDPTQTQVRDSMTTGEITCSQYLSIEEVALLMKQVNHKYFIVLNEENEVVGIVSRHEAVECVKGHNQ